MDTFNSQNFMGYAQSAGNLSFLLCLSLLNLAKEDGVSGSSSSPLKGEKMQDASEKKTDKSSSETTRETSFNFKNYREISGISPDKISDA